MPSASLDWLALEDHIHSRMFDEVRTYRQRQPEQNVYSAAFHAFYGETGGVIYWPALSLGTEAGLVEASAGSSFSPDDLRWSPADWPVKVDPSADDEAWAARVQQAAVGGGDEEWEAVCDRFLRTFALAAKDARRMLISSDVVDETFLALAIDEEWQLIPLSLTPEQLHAQFPELAP